MTGERGWFFPTSARKCHYDGGDGKSLCGKWGRFGLTGNTAPIVAGLEDGKYYPSPDDCTSCKKKLRKLLEGEI